MGSRVAIRRGLLSVALHGFGNGVNSGTVGFSRENGAFYGEGDGVIKIIIVKDSKTIAFSTSMKSTIFVVINIINLGIVSTMLPHHHASSSSIIVSTVLPGDPMASKHPFEAAKNQRLVDPEVETLKSDNAK